MGKGPGRRWQGPSAVGSSRPVGGTPGPFVRMAYLVAFCSPDSGGTASGRVPRHPGLRPLHACESPGTWPSARFQCWTSSALLLSFPSLHPREAGPWLVVHGAQAEARAPASPPGPQVPSLRVHLPGPRNRLSYTRPVPSPLGVTGKAGPPTRTSR